MSQHQLLQLGSQLLKHLESFTAEGNDSVDKEVILRLTDTIRYMCEDPKDAFVRQWQATYVLAAINVLRSTGAFDRIPREGTIAATQLARQANVDISVITRSMRLLTSQGIGEEREPDTYSHNSKSLALTSGQPIGIMFDLMRDSEFALRKLPEYFRTHTIDDFFDIRKIPYVFALDKEGKTFYEAISDDPERLQIFNLANAQAESMFPVKQLYPFQALQAQVQAGPERPFIVDIGGGRGSTLLGILEEAPHGFGSAVILQDRADVLNSIAEHEIPGITKMAHDFFQPQPVKNAHVYFIRRCLHNFYPGVCIGILKNIAAAMGPTSRLLCCDAVIPEKTSPGNSSMTYWMDFMMMTIGGQEKTAREFAQIADGAGLEVVKIWSQGGSEMQAVVEMRLKG